MEEFNAIAYPEGVERAGKEFLFFLPEDNAIRDNFMDLLLQCMLLF